MKVLVMLVALINCSFVLAQAKQKDRALDSIYPFKKAVLFSAVVPGSGQIFNSMHHSQRKNAYWKVPLIYAGLGATAWLIFQNQQTVQSIKTEYSLRQIAAPVDPTWMNYDDLALVSLYDQYARRRDLCILGMGAVYLFQLLDAAVEAHFLHFSVTPNLSMNLQPYVIPRAFGCSATLHLNSNIRR